MLPDAAELLARYSSLVLGDFDTAAHHTRYTRQRISTNGLPAGTLERFFRKPFELVQKTAGSIILNGYNASFAWEVREGEARILAEHEEAGLRSAAAFYDGVLPVPAAMIMMRGATVGEVPIEDGTAYAITPAESSLAAAEAGGLPIAYISKSTGLLARTRIGGENNPFFIVQTFAEYRDFGGLLVPTELTITSRTGATDLNWRLRLKRFAGTMFRTPSLSCLRQSAH